MSKTKIVRDPVHKDIFLSELQVELIDTPAFQRLRRIRQLGVTNLVYPSANHTRFEHSVGASHIASRIADRLSANDQSEALKIAALLHDLGHGPLSHTSEELLEKYLNHSHEEITLNLIRKSEIGDILQSSTIQPQEIVDILSNKSVFSALISGEVDVDRMDYLSRDAYHTGVAYGIIDLDRLINTMDLMKKNIVITMGGLRAVEGLLVARFLMMPTVYLHRTSRIADAMFLRATERAIETGLLDLDRFYQMDDVDVHCLFRCSMGFVRDIGKRIDNRRLFKTALKIGGEELDNETRLELKNLQKDVKKWNSLEIEMADDAGVDPGYVILDIPPKPSYEEHDALLSVGSKFMALHEISPLVKILKEVEEGQWSVGVYTPKEHLNKVSPLCKNLKGYIV